MRTRPLKPDEYQFLLRAFGTPKEKHPVRTFFGISACISLPLFVLFVTVSIFAEKRTAPDALRRGIPVLFFGPAFLLVQRFAPGKTRSPHPFAAVHDDMKAGFCQIREFRVRRMWPLIDQGNDDTPDYLAETDARKYIAVSRENVQSQLPFRRRLEIHELPKSRTTVAIRFSGDELAIEPTPINTDNVWRNDDLPWDRPLGAQRLPEEAQKIVQSGKNED